MLNLFGHTGKETTPAHPSGLLQDARNVDHFHFHCVFMLRYGN